MRSLDNYERHSKNYSDVTAFADNVGNGAYLEYLSAEDSSSLNLLLSKLQHKIIDKRNSEYVCHKSELLANKSLHILKWKLTGNPLLNRFLEVLDILHLLGKDSH